MNGSRRVPLERLSATTFAPFGDVVEPYGDGRAVNDKYGIRHEVATNLGPITSGTAPCLALYHLQSRPCPVIVHTLEQHRYTTQTFIPLSPCPFLVIVAPADADGEPDGSGSRAFAASGSVGITYRPGVWHAGLTTLGGQTTFAMLMWQGSQADCIFAALSPAIEIDLTMQDWET